MNACTTSIATPDSIEYFQITAGKDSLKIEFAAPVQCDASILFKEALTLQSGSRELISFFIHGKDKLTSLLLEIALAIQSGHGTVNLDNVELFGCAQRGLSQLVKHVFWNNLTRQLDGSNAAVTEKDPKIITDNPRPRIYIPHSCPEQYEFYSKFASEHPDVRLDVQVLPVGPLTPEFVRDLNTRPGVLALAMKDVVLKNGEHTLQPQPFVVPGGRFNEMYGWDTYFEIIGLLHNGYVDVCESMIRNFCFCIQHYGKMLNANRSYYLGRSQPPFLTAMALAVTEKMGKDNPKASDLLKLTAFAAILEYHSVWASEPRYHVETGLSRYGGTGKGFPPEVERDHYKNIIEYYANKHSMTPSDFERAYNQGDIEETGLDEYLKHDRSCRESGHDTTYRFVGRAADLAAVDLNSCLYRYETDLAHILEDYFDGSLKIPSDFQAPGGPATETASWWRERAAKRRDAVDKYLWCADGGMYFDYDTKNAAQMSYENATTLWPLWSGLASQAQADSLVKHAIPKLEAHGGLVASTERSRGELSPDRPPRQWDYPHGWAPHQILAWDGLRKYGHRAVAERLAYRWVSMVLRTYAHHDGIVVEKYDVTKDKDNHIAEAEYGNQGSDFSSRVQTG